MPYGSELIPLAVKGAKGLAASKHLIPMLIGAGFLGQTALSEIGKAGERGLTREQIRLNKLLAENQAEATKKATKESRSRADDYVKTLLKAQETQKAESREAMLLQNFMQGQDRQAMMLMQAIQGITQNQPKYSAGAGMLGLMRGV